MPPKQQQPQQKQQHNNNNKQAQNKPQQTKPSTPDPNVVSFNLNPNQHIIAPITKPNNDKKKDNKKKNDKNNDDESNNQPKLEDQSEVPPVVTAIRTKQDITFIAMPIQPTKFPQDPQRLKSKINNPTSDLIWSPLGDRCAVCTTDGIIVYNIPINPGAEFELHLHAILPYTTGRYLQFSPLGTFLLSYETFTRSCPVNLMVWDLKQWANMTHTPPTTIISDDESSESTESIPTNPDETTPTTTTITPKRGGIPPQPLTTAKDVLNHYPSVVFAMSQRQDLPTLPHSSVQWTDDEEYTFVLREVGEICCFKSNSMTKALTTLQQKRLGLFQLSKMPKNGDKNQQYVALFSSCHGSEPAKCTIFKTLEIVRGQSLVSGSVAYPQDPPNTVRPPVYGQLKPCQQVAIFRTTDCSMQWHSGSQALLLKTNFDDGSGRSYYGETRLYVVYVDKEAVAVSFGADSKGEIHDAAWCPTNFEFTTLHGPSRDATCTIWHARDCSAVRSIGSGPFNLIRYNPSGRLLLLTGVGSLSGKLEIWDKKNLLRLYRGQDDDSPRTLTWTPCGRYFISATIFPYLRVGNQFKIQKFDGKLLYQEKAKQSATTLTIQSESSITLAQQGPDEGHFLQVCPNYYPRTNYFSDVRIPPELISKAQNAMRTEPTVPSSEGKYIPPHLREQQQNAPAPLLPERQHNTNNGPRDFVKERKQGHNVDVGFGAKPATQSSQQVPQQREQVQQTTTKPKNVVSDEYGSWRR